MDVDNPNIRVYHPPDDGEEEGCEQADIFETAEPPRQYVKTLVETIHPDYDPENIKLPKFSPQELIGLTFLHDTEDGQRIRAEVIKHNKDREGENHKNIKFVIEYGDPVYEEIIAYVELSDIIQKQHAEKQNNDEQLWTFKRILDHQGPLC